MLLFPNAKINIGLQIINRRKDGYHDIRSCFYPVPWTDILEIVPTERNTTFTASGIPIPEDGGSNLCLKAYHLLKADFDIPPVKMHLHKLIPIGAGLGGGSADASFALKWLNEAFSLQLSDVKLQTYAASIGSDCPFFIKNKPVLASDTGTTLTPFTVDLGGYHILMIFPDQHISTKEAYSGVKPSSPKYDLAATLAQPVEKWKDIVYNDFEDSILPRYPQLKLLKEKLYAAGASYASMTGSGAAFYALFKTKPEVEALQLPEKYITKLALL